MALCYIGKANLQEQLLLVLSTLVLYYSTNVSVELNSHEALCFSGKVAVSLFFCALFTPVSSHLHGCVRVSLGKN